MRRFDFHWVIGLDTVHRLILVEIMVAFIIQIIVEFKTIIAVFIESPAGIISRVTKLFVMLFRNLRRTSQGLVGDLRPHVENRSQLWCDVSLSAGEPVWPVLSRHRKGSVLSQRCIITALYYHSVVLHVLPTAGHAPLLFSDSSPSSPPPPSPSRVPGVSIVLGSLLLKEI